MPVKNIRRLIFVIFAFVVATTVWGTSCFGFPFPPPPPEGNARLFSPQFAIGGAWLRR